MAVIMNTNISVLAASINLGISEKYLSFLQAYTVRVITSVTQKVTFEVILSSGPSVKMTTQLMASGLKAAEANNIAPMSAQGLKAALISDLDNFMDHVSDADGGLFHHEKKFSKSFVAEPEPKLQLSGGVPIDHAHITTASGGPIINTEAALADILGMEPVKLTQATQMYQPVTSTTGGSMYHVIALARVARVAARFKGDLVSMRIEGFSKKHHEALEANGFNIHGGDYASLHVDCANAETNNLARRTIGAVLMGLGMTFRTPTPNLSVIEQEGK